MKTVVTVSVVRNEYIVCGKKTGIPVCGKETVRIFLWV